MENEDTIPKVEEEEEDQLNLPSKKKKKKKKVKELDLDAEPTEAEADDESKPTKVSFQVDGENGDVEEDDFDLSRIKKKKKKKEKRPIDENEAPADAKDGDDKLWSGDRDYTYDELLTRAFLVMKQLNPDMEAGKKKKFIMKPPQCARVGTKKTSFVNFGEICGMLRRQPKHIVAFILAELGASGSVDGNSQLIIKGRFQQKQLESVLRKYIKEYVTCHTCRSPDTVLERDVRLYFLRCNVCKSRCSVATIKSGFQAVTGKRARIRAKAGS